MRSNRFGFLSVRFVSVLPLLVKRAASQLLVTNLVGQDGKAISRVDNCPALPAKGHGRDAPWHFQSNSTPPGRMERRLERVVSTNRALLIRKRHLQPPVWLSSSNTFSRDRLGKQLFPSTQMVGWPTDFFARHEFEIRPKSTHSSDDSGCASAVGHTSTA